MNRLFLIFLLAMSLPVMAQDREYELQDPYPAPAEAWNAVKSVTFGWGTIDERYQRNAVPALSAKLQLSAWRGERVSAQAVLLAPRAIKSVSAKVSDLKSGKNIIPAAAVNKYFVCYSMADGYRNKNGKHENLRLDRAMFDSCLVADRLSPLAEMSVPAKTLRPIWLDIRIPQNAAPGKYSAVLSVNCDGETTSIPFTVEVNKHVLPAPKD